MLAQVIDISDQWIYLEIENQLRFRADYRLTEVLRDVHPSDKISFEFEDGQKSGGTVLIAQIIETDAESDI